MSLSISSQYRYTNSHVLPRLHKTIVEWPMTFGGMEWNTHCGPVVDIPPIPDNIVEVYHETCPFFGTPIRENYILTLMPKRVGNTPLSLCAVPGIMLKRDLAFSFFSPEAEMPLGWQEISEAYWFLIMKGIIPGSLGQPYTEQQRLVEEIGGKELYGCPSALEAAVSLCGAYLKEKKMCFEHIPWTCGLHPWAYTHCRDTVPGGRYPGDLSHLSVGFFSPGEIVVSANRHSPAGLAAIRKI